jgi:glycosyltransferase involved in cell wall biosynthesis
VRFNHCAPLDATPALLLVSTLQFGVHTDTTKYCEHLRGRFRLTYLCLDQGLPRRVLDGVEIVYCGRRPFGKVELGLFLDSVRLLRSRSFGLVFLRRWKLCFLLRLLFPRVPMIFDIRSGSIETGAFRRALEDSLTWFNSLFFRHVTVISEGLARGLRLPRKAHVLPLGADPTENLTRRQADFLRLIYVGTFKNRHLELTIAGLRRYLDDGPGVSCSYTIIGFGPESDVDRLRTAVADHALESIVEIRDRVDHDALGSVLADHDVGVAFTPRVAWYEHQPSTKVFEYLASGLLCIATESAANREVITPENGVLIEASPEGFCAGLKAVANTLRSSEPIRVAETVHDYSWARIVCDNLLPYLQGLMR